VCEERAKSNKIVAVYLGRKLAKKREMVTLVNGKEACTLRDSNSQLLGKLLKIAKTTKEKSGSTDNTN